jgi:PIN domain nuclease of toxin-antitoxin system
MNLLLDTSTFLWWITSDSKLSERAQSLIAGESNTLFVSAASGWEIATKFAIGKLPLPGSPSIYVPEQMQINGFVALPVEMSHSLHVHSLPLHHKDPFDRILIAQSQIESMPILTADPLIKQYGVPVLW